MSVIPVRMKVDTIEQVTKLQNRVQASSRSHAIRTAIEISDLLMNSIEKGDQIIINCKDGTQKEILISGLNN